MGAWSCVLDVIEGEAIPVRILFRRSMVLQRSLLMLLFCIQTYYFARDDRVFKAFQDRVHDKRVDIARHASKRLRWQLRVLERVLDGRTTTYRVSLVDCLHSYKLALNLIFTEQSRTSSGGT